MGAGGNPYCIIRKRFCDKIIESAGGIGMLKQS